MTETNTEETPRWGMVIDLNRCVGCQTCTIACKHANDTLPGVQWRRVLDVETGEYPNVERVFMVTGCQHCAEPPCVPVCPTGATKQRLDGLVTMDYEMCIGCASCAVACPYQARTIAHDQDWYYGEETVQEKKVEHSDRLGVAQKCTFCIERIDDAKELGLKPGIDMDVTPACSASCIAQAIQFGDFNDPTSNVSELAADGSIFQMHEELGTDPQIKYRYETPRVPGRSEIDADNSEEMMSDPANPLVGQRQTFWDMRAAMNFIMGGFGAGLVIIATLLHFVAGLPADRLLQNYMVAGAIIAVGLFFVWLKIGRKLRAPFVILRPQTSWMSREVYAVALVFIFGFIDYLSPSPVLHALTALAALLFLYCQTKILHMSKGIPTWRVAMMPWMLLMSGLYEGVGVAALYVAVVPVAMPTTYTLPLLGMLLALANLVLWRNYISGAKRRGIGALSRADLRRATPSIMLIAHLVPFLLFGIFMFWPLGPAWLLGVGGALVLAGGALWKSVVITRACHQQGFALGKWPQRGSGEFAAPSGTVASS